MRTGAAWRWFLRVGVRRALLSALPMGAAVLMGAALLAGCGATATPSSAGQAVGNLRVTDVVARPGPAGGISGAFLTVVNTGSSPDRLVSASSPVAPTTELHETIDDNGVMKMRPALSGFEIPANGRLELKPGGKHVMFVGLTSAVAVGNQLEITLTFEKAGTITLKAPVKQ